MDFPKYPKVLNSGDTRFIGLGNFEGKFYVSEKVDGSQFRFGIDREGNHYFGSKSVTFDDSRPPDTMFSPAVDIAGNLLSRLGKTVNEVVFFAEYLESEKHNSIRYDRIPENHLYLFDVMVDGRFQYPDEVIRWAGKIGVEPLHLLTVEDTLPDESLVTQLNRTVSVLGGPPIEGLVVKNYDTFFTLHGRIRFFSDKFVRKEFKELNDAIWKKERKAGVHSIPDLISALMETVTRENVWNKAIQHLREEGRQELSMRDMKGLTELVEADMEEEFSESIKEVLYLALKGQIRREFQRGLAPYYKSYLGEGDSK